MENLAVLQRIMLWVTIWVYFISWLGFVFGIIFGKERLLPWAIRLSIAGIIIHGIWIIMRWVETGHRPYINLYDVASSNGIIAMIIFLLALWKYPKLKALGLLFLPLVFLLMGFGALSTRKPVGLSPILDSSWLVVHVMTAKLAFGSYLVSGVLAVSYLLKYREHEGGILKWFPVNPVNEELNRKFVTLGFLNHTVMLVSGSIWANVAFGSYWSWDPIETWSLISWIIYGIFFHLITIHGWKGRRMAWLSIVALISIAFALFGVPLLFKGSHNLFL